MLYSQAIELNPTDPTIYCNRESMFIYGIFTHTSNKLSGAYARMKLEEQGFAIDDASS